jgi:DNA-binding winged helix-turn-helix (wHTH) protein/TolB-like protein
MPSVLRFDRFEFHVDSGELISLDSRFRLEPQPAKLLALLACRPGELVSREELQREIWPADTFVDFERGINYCIRSIRRALDDSAAAPRFIETLPRRGYRFLPAVEGLTGSPSVETEGPAGESVLGSPAPSARDWRRVVLLLAGSAAALIVVCSAVVLSTRSAPAAPTVAVTLFDNETGRPDLDRIAQIFTDTAVERLARDATRWSVIGNAAILRKPRPFRNLEAIASSLHADFIVLGQIEPAVEGVTVLTHLIRARDQRHLWVGRFEAAAILDPSLPGRVAERVADAAEQRIGR